MCAEWETWAPNVVPKFPARVVVFCRWRENRKAVAIFWLRRIVGALYATPPERRAKAAVLLGLAWKKLTLQFRAATSDDVGLGWRAEWSGDLNVFGCNWV